MKRIIITAIWVISMFHVVSIEAQAPGCPSINAGPDQNVDCTNPCVTLTATVLATGTTGSYSVSSIPYAPPAAYGGGTGVTVHADDMWSGVITLPFPFCFYGNQYTQVVTGSNAITSFELSYAGAFCPWDQRTQGTIPTSNYPINSIMWPYEDVDNSSTGDFTYELIGTAPCRMLVVSATNIPYYGGVNSINTSFCTSPPIYATSMLVLYETTNVIEIYNQNKYVCSGWNDGYAIEGIQDATGANAAFVPGRNNTQWTATNDAWRFTPNGTPNYTVTWWQGATQIASGISTTVCPTSTTTYTAQVVYNLCPGGQLTLTDDVVVNAVITAPTPTITGTLSICSGSSTTLDAGSPYSSYSWSNSANTQTITVSPVVTTTYTVTVTNSSGCSGTASVVVNVNSLTPAITGPLSVCSGSSTTLDAGGPYSTYSWSNSANTQIITVSPVIATTYTVTVVNGSGCTGTASVVVSINPNLSPAITGISSICSGSTTTLDAGGPYFSYSWSNSANTQTTSVSPVVNTTYTVTVSNGSGCTGTASEAVAVNVNPTPTIIGPPSICSGSSTTLDAGGGFSSYSWSNSANTQTTTVSPVVATTYTVTVSTAAGCTGSTSIAINISANLTPAISGPLSVCSGSSTTLDAGGPYSTYSWSNSANTQIITVSPVVATTYTVTVSNGSGCTGTASVVVNINPNLTPAITGILSICSGNSTTLDAGGPYSTYSWSNSANTQIITVSPVVATTYTVTVSNGSGCTGTASEAVTINPNPTPPTITGPSSICSGTTTTLDAGGGYSNYSWSNSAITQTITVSPVVATTYTVTVTNGSGCTATASEAVTMNPNPTPPTITGPSSICTGNTATLDAGGGYSTYSWNTLATTETIPVTTAGTYTVTVTNGSSCSATASTVITVNSSPVAFAGNDTTICNGSNVPLVATGGGSYAWSNGASTASNTVHPNVTTTYTVTVTTGVGCSASNNVLVTVKPFTPPNIAAIGPRGFCAGSSNPAILIASSGYISYLWSNGATTQTDTIHTIGTYWVIATSANGCSDTSAAMVLYNFPAAIPPVIVADDTTDFCEGDSISVIMHTTTPYYDYNWAGGSTTPEIDVTHVGNYDVTVTDSNGCTAVSNIIPVKFIPKPVAYFNDGASGTTLTFYNTSLNGQTYLWEFGDGDTSTAFDPVHQYAVPGTDTIKLIASNICGSDTQIVIIKVGFGPGIQENMFVDNVSVYPVPTNGDIAVTFDYSGLTALDVKIYNLLGQIQYRETVNELTGKYHNIINMSQMSTGIYLLQIISDKGSVNIKLVKG